MGVGVGDLGGSEGGGGLVLADLLVVATIEMEMSAEGRKKKDEDLRSGSICTASNNTVRNHFLKSAHPTCARRQSTLDLRGFFLARPLLS
jgi:hypothetical protein